MPTLPVCGQIQRLVTRGTANVAIKMTAAPMIAGAQANEDRLTLTVHGENLRLSDIGGASCV